MNATKAKQLRKLAMRVTDTTTLKRSIKVDGMSPQFQNIMGFHMKVQKGIPMQYHHNCSYRVYKDLKKSYNAYKFSPNQLNYTNFLSTLH